MQIDPLSRNNVRVLGPATAEHTVLFMHGFGCDQSMWTRMLPAFAPRFRVVLMDFVGAGGTDPAHYDAVRYASLAGYARDVLEVLAALDAGPVTYVGHSVSAMVGLLAAIAQPARFTGLAMVAPSPCYIDEGDYRGGFSRQDIEGLLDFIDQDYAAWSRALAPVVMGTQQPSALAGELEQAFCRTDPRIAQRFARVTFLSDHRADLPRVPVPALILQCSQDAVAPESVGEHMHRAMPGSTLVRLAATGHCPHVSAPEETSTAILDWLAVR